MSKKFIILKDLCYDGYNGFAWHQHEQKGDSMSINSDRFKQVMGNYPTGVTIVTTADEHGTPFGMTVNSFASVSLEPSLILWSIDKRANSYDVFTQTKRFAVHILASDQADLAVRFATKGIDRFALSKWEWSAYRLPILSDVAGVLQCQTYQTIEAGDHMILIGEVIAIEDYGKKPLLYHKRTFGEIHPSFYANNK